jgi:hypothetical protein
MMPDATHYRGAREWLNPLPVNRASRGFSAVPRGVPTINWHLVGRGLEKSIGFCRK